MTKDASLLQKQQFLQKHLGTYAALSEPASLPGNPVAKYRRRVVLATEYSHQWKFGTRSRDQIIAIHDCPVHHPLVNNVIHILASQLLPPDEFPMVYFVMNNAQAVIVLKSSRPVPESFPEKILEDQLKAAGLEGLHIHYHPSAGKKVIGKPIFSCVWGKTVSFDDEGIAYGPGSFQQLIPQLLNDAYLKVINFFQVDKKCVFLDLYCGSGKLLKTMFASGIKNALGVEISGEAVGLAAINAPEAEILRGTCEQRIPQIENWIREIKTEDSCLCVFSNPPRTGMGNKISMWLAENIHPDKLAILSCSPATLAKDLEYFTKTGYRVHELLPYDFFPGTHHVETLVLLSAKRTGFY